VIKKVLNFIRESREELKKVTWPDREEVTSFTMVVIISVVIISLFLWFVDTLLGKLINTVMN
jgi:preprotein translocase subunit SecE